jgi:hypothetical protein
MDIFDMPTTATFEFVKHVLLSWVLGIGPDLSLDNFLIYDTHCYQVDMESIKCLNWKFSDVTVWRGENGPLLLGFIMKHWPIFEQWVAGLDLIHVEDDMMFSNWVAERLDTIGTFNGIASLFNICHRNRAIVDQFHIDNPLSLASNQPACKRRRLNEAIQANKDRLVVIDRQGIVTLPPPPLIVVRNPTPPTLQSNHGIPQSPTILQPTTSVRASSTTFRNVTCANGYSDDAIKIDFTTAVCLGNARQALLAFFALYAFNERFDRTHQRVKSVVTSIINHAIICAMENIGVANTELVTEVISAAKYKRDDTNNWAITVVKMCTSPKTHIGLYLTHAYGIRNLHLKFNTSTYPLFNGIIDDRHQTSMKCFISSLSTDERTPDMAAAIGVFNKAYETTKSSSAQYIAGLFHFGTSADTTQPVQLPVYVKDLMLSTLPYVPYKIADNAHLSRKKMLNHVDHRFDWGENYYLKSKY